MTANDNLTLLNRQEAAALLRITPRTLDRQQGLPRVRLTPGRVLFRKNDLLAWIEKKASEAQARGPAA